MAYESAQFGLLSHPFEEALCLIAVELVDVSVGSLLHVEQQSPKPRGLCNLVNFDLRELIAIL